MRRRSDNHSPGYVLLKGPGNFMARRHMLHDSPTQGFASMDAAVHWVLGNTQVPDTTSYRHVGGVYGRVLARWHGFKLLGHVWSTSGATAPGLGSRNKVLPSTFVVLDRMNRICARMQWHTNAWKLVVAHRDRMTVTCRQRRHLHDALRVLCMEISTHHLDISGHAKMLLVQGVDLIVPRAETFLVRLPGWRDALYAAPPDHGVDPAVLDARMRTTHTLDPIVLKRGDLQVFGEITCQDTGYQAARKTLHDQDLVIGATETFASLDESLAWLQRNPDMPARSCIQRSKPFSW